MTLIIHFWKPFKWFKESSIWTILWLWNPFPKFLGHFKTPNFKKKNILENVRTYSFAFSPIYESVLECWNIFAIFFVWSCSIISCEPKVKLGRLSSVGVLQLAKCLPNVIWLIVYNFSKEGIMFVIFQTTRLCITNMFLCFHCVHM